MEQTSLFTVALGLQAPWKVIDARFKPADHSIHFDAAFERGSRFTCPACGAEAQPVHDTLEREWRHLNCFQYAAYLHAQTPRVRCRQCGKTRQVEPPWARPQSGFTQLMEALIILLCQAMPVARVAEIPGIGDNRIWRVPGADSSSTQCIA